MLLLAVYSMINLNLPPLVIVISIYAFLSMLYVKLVPFLNGSRQVKMVVYEEFCNGCGNCVIACPSNALISTNVSGGKGPLNGEVVMEIEDGRALEFNMNFCERVTKPNVEPCKICLDSCPLDAIDFTY